MRTTVVLPGPVRRLCVAGIIAFTHGLAPAQVLPIECGDLSNGYGPYDYQTDRDKLPIVENHHFKPQVELLIKGISGYVGGDLDYVLRAFPNHHRALVAMMRLSERHKWTRPPGALFDIDCYFDRALRFRPKDVVSRQLYASYLIKRSRKDEASAQLARAEDDAGDNGFTHYNIGLLYADLGAYDKALLQAHKAQELGFTRPELMRKLRAAGRWKDPERPTGSKAPASSASTPG